MQRKGMGNLSVLLIALVVIGIGALAYTAGGGGLLSVGEKGEASLITKDSTATPDVNVKAYDLENKGTALTEATNLYRRIGDTSWSAFTAGTAIADLQPGEKYEFVMGITTSDFTDNAYGDHFTTEDLASEGVIGINDDGTLDYVSSIVVEKGLHDDSAETALTATFYDSNHDVDEETFTTGQSKNVYLKFEAGTDDVFGNPNVGAFPNVLCLNLNATAWDAPEEVAVGSDTLRKVGTPQRHSVDSTDSAYCYEAPVITDAGVEFRVRLNADDTNAPTLDDTASIYAGSWFINGDTGNVESGVEDQDGTAVGTDAADTLTLDFTA